MSIASYRLLRQRLDAQAWRSRSVSDQTSSSASRRQLVALLDALHAGGEQRPRRRGRGCTAASMVRSSMRVDWPLLGLYIGTRTIAERLLWPQQMYGGRLAAAEQPLVGVDPLVGDGGDLGGVRAGCRR